MRLISFHLSNVDALSIYSIYYFICSVADHSEQEILIINLSYLVSTWYQITKYN